MTTKRLVGKCPVCDGEFKVTRLACDQCGSALEGEFALCRFCTLSREQQRFVEVFIASRGNIKEVEKALGISYPTVRSRLDEVIQNLGYQVQRPSAVDRKAVLEALDRGEISAEEAIKQLREAD